jgi:hypothetical protein
MFDWDDPLIRPILRAWVEYHDAGGKLEWIEYRDRYIDLVLAIAEQDSEFFLKREKT